MSYLNTLLSQRSTMGIYLEKIEELNLISFQVNEQRNQCLANVNKSNIPEVGTILRLAVTHGMPSVIETFLYSQIFYHGPKVFRPSKLQCEALENVEVNLSFDEYAQPFPTIIVEIPDNYERLIPCEQAGEIRLDAEGLYPMEHRVAFVVLNWNPSRKILAAGGYFTSGQCYTRFFWQRNPGETIENALTESQSLELPGSMSSSNAESVAFAKALQVALNAANMLMIFGHRTASSNKKYTERCAKHISTQEKAKNPVKLNNARRELKLIPLLMELREPVITHVEEKENSSIVGTIIRPHWRKGYWKQQPHGPGNTLRKRILIPAVMVNKHLL